MRYEMFLNWAIKLLTAQYERLDWDDVEQVKDRPHRFANLHGEARLLGK